MKYDTYGWTTLNQTAYEIYIFIDIFDTCNKYNLTC